jgi:hypothetical protein
MDSCGAPDYNAAFYDSSEAIANNNVPKEAAAAAAAVSIYGTSHGGSHRRCNI